MKQIRLAIDVESGDFGPQVIISGLIEACKTSRTQFKALLCGNRDRILSILDAVDADRVRQNFEIVHCTDTIMTDEVRARVWKKRVDSSIIRCIALQKDGIVDASVSAGDTAILLGASLFILGRSDGAIRPALAAFLPTIKKKPVLLLDVGANLNCRAEHLVSFALLGQSYVCRYLENTTPAVALLNVGKEPIKGPRSVCEAGEILEKRCQGFYGFVEGNGVLSGDVDIVVCDGFAGNILLKACESFYALAQSMLGKKSDYVKSHMATLDPENYGAVPFLGIKGTVMKAHGGSSSRAIANAILASIKAVERNAVWSRIMRPKGNEHCGKL
jgi:glycerol-3-phosphate acyltransferase PlsX